MEIKIKMCTNPYNSYARYKWRQNDNEHTSEVDKQKKARKQQQKNTIGWAKKHNLLSSDTVQTAVITHDCFSISFARICISNWLLFARRNASTDFNDKTATRNRWISSENEAIYGKQEIKWTKNKNKSLRNSSF